MGVIGVHVGSRQILCPLPGGPGDAPVPHREQQCKARN